MIIVKAYIKKIELSWCQLFHHWWHLSNATNDDKVGIITDFGFQCVCILHCMSYTSLVQMHNCGNSIANALELLQSYSQPLSTLVRSVWTSLSLLTNPPFVGYNRQTLIFSSGQLSGEPLSSGVNFAGWMDWIPNPFWQFWHIFSFIFCIQIYTH